MTDENVVHLRDGRPPLTDVAGRLRTLAADIDEGRIEASTAFVVIPQVDDYPRVYGYGETTGVHDPLIQFELAKHFLLTNLVSR